MDGVGRLQVGHVDPLTDAELLEGLDHERSRERDVGHLLGCLGCVRETSEMVEEPCRRWIVDGLLERHRIVATRVA
ncbi:hypothetical protein COV05_00680 [Candidatus Uhrbacteria bacterium CG10_big_fil_rev_8_21_14_0_10_48_16]|uniref:Uncharacterized protein n=1 Tax=Candidatus Uhrbacteria bacterium CG10_big_fil_rev_8_21_14_0_10_48_16 TaxID=1975038 RepID=A0A2M8LI37_9BACT|nr:MAG: hypothetical protein COV05_00680 [Candidatus Uhrbacteria bacterium CG10_big_fil_rev_8_21_14_0_10_48_16]